MNNNRQIKVASLIITLAILVIGLLAIWFTYKTVTPVDTKSTETKKAVEVNKNVYEKVTSPEKFGTEISPNEEGYGREDPFAPYK
jgi:p-aminobenzoyl-glutamate transporter AbgT